MESNNTSKGCKCKYKRIINKWGLFTTFDGIPRIISSKSIFIKLLWSFFFLVALGFCFYQIVDTIIQYTRNETKSSIKIERYSSVDFPAVTFCVPPSHGHYSTLLDETTKINFSMIDMNINQIKLNLAQKRLENEKEYLEYDFDLNYNLLHCDFNGIECNASQFTAFWHNEYGNCFTFNDGTKYSILKINQVGNTNGLKLILNLSKVTGYLNINYN